MVTSDSVAVTVSTIQREPCALCIRSLNCCGSIARHARDFRVLILSASCLLIIVSMLGIFSRARADLRVARNTSHAEYWQRLYGGFPGVWKNRSIVLVREMSDARMDRMAERDGYSEDEGVVVSALYRPGDSNGIAGTIMLRRSLRGEEAAFIFCHEYGHFVWNELLTADDQDGYSDLWKRSKRRDQLVSEYATESAEESFCEAFACLMRDAAKLRRRDVGSLKFLNNVAKRLSSGGTTSR